jgi:uncharacterized repeat protein (TIGR03803 family)
MRPFANLLVTLIAMSVLPATQGQTFKVLHSFTGGTSGANPWNHLLVSGSTLLGITKSDVRWGGGTIFKIGTDGSGFSVLHKFTPRKDGGSFYDSLTLSNSTLYGTTYGTASHSSGIIFDLGTDGRGYSILHSFAPTPAGGSPLAIQPYGSLTLSGSTLFGTTQAGFRGNGKASEGTVFKINTDGSGFDVLHWFGGSEEGHPLGDLCLSGSTLYGTTRKKKSPRNCGTIFKINIGGSGFRVLHEFSNDSNDATPWGGMTLSGSTLYGTTRGGKPPVSFGTVFRIDTDGSGFKVLHTFAGDDKEGGPWGSVALSGSTIYGTASTGGSTLGSFLGNGTIFSVGTDGSSFSVLHTFHGTDGAVPSALTLSGSTLYGTAFWGGSSNNGVVFSLTIPSARSPR